MLWTVNKDYVEVKTESDGLDSDIEESEPLQRTMERIQSVNSTDSTECDAYKTTFLGFTQPFSPWWCLSVTGSEYTHILFWILKDLSWTQGWQFLALFSGSLSLFWVLVILYHAIRIENRDEIYNAIGIFLWLLSNFWWMGGETHDLLYPTPPECCVIKQHAIQSGYMLACALLFLSVYYLIVLPFNLFPVNLAAISAYDDGQSIPRFPRYFKTFRQYENSHMLFWILKDWAWCTNRANLWILFLVPTVLIPCDILYHFLRKVRYNYPCFSHPYAPPSQHHSSPHPHPYPHPIF